MEKKTTVRREKSISFTDFTAAPEPNGSMQEPRLTRFMILLSSRKPIEDDGLLPQSVVQNVCPYGNLLQSMRCSTHRLQHVMGISREGLCRF